ncbi:MAG: T9SS type A sorting domain-containing protein [Cytophagales bacterium]|nr:T9SS type A sorting domain-containing protein [Cytophagales bacterium]
MKELLLVLVASLLSTATFAAQFPVSVYHSQSDNLLEMMVSDSMYVSELESNVADRLNANEEDISLYFKGDTLMSQNVLTYYGIMPNDTLLLGINQSNNDQDTTQNNTEVVNLYFENESFNQGHFANQFDVNEDSSLIVMGYVLKVFTTGNGNDSLGVVKLVENNSNARINQDVEFLRLANPEDWTFNTEDKAFEIQDGVLLSKEQLMALNDENREFEIVIESKEGQPIGSSNDPKEDNNDDDSFELNSRQDEIDGGFGEVANLMINPDSTATFDLIIGVSAFQTIGNDLGNVKLYANEKFNGLEKGDLLLTGSTSWTFDQEDEVFVSITNFTTTKEQTVAIFLEEKDIYVDVTQKSEEEYVLLSTREDIKVYYELNSDDYNDSDSYAEAIVEEKFDGSSELKISLYINTEEDLTQVLGDVNFHTLFEITDLDIDDVLFPIAPAQMWSYDGDQQAYVLRASIDLTKEETFDFLEGTIAYININDLNGGIAYTSRPQEEELELFAVKSHENTIDSSSTTISFYYDALSNVFMYAEFVVKAKDGINLDTLLGASGLFRNDEVIIPLLMGTEWKFENGFYTAWAEVRLNQEQIEALDNDDDEDLNISVLHKQKDELVLTTDNPAYGYYSLNNLTTDLKEGSVEVLFSNDEQGNPVMYISAEVFAEDQVNALDILGNLVFFASEDITDEGVTEGDPIVIPFTNSSWSYDTDKDVYVAETTVLLDEKQLSILRNYDEVIQIIVTDVNNIDDVVLTSLPLFYDEVNLNITREYSENFGASIVEILGIQNPDSTMSIEFEFAVSTIGDSDTLLGDIHLVSNEGLFKILDLESDWSYDAENDVFTTSASVDFTKEETEFLIDNDVYFNVLNAFDPSKIVLTDRDIITNISNALTKEVTIGTSTGNIHIITNEKATVTIYNTLGQIVSNTTVNGNTTIPTNTTGLHIIVVETATNTTKEKITLH